MTTERHDEGGRGEGGRGEGWLDDLLADARDLRPPPSEALLARILADAEAEAPVRARPRAAARGAGPGPLRALGALAEFLGGWPALGGLAASAVLGLGLGWAQAPAVSGLLPSAWGGGGVSLALGLDEDPLGALDADAASVDG
jgi:hypothetical protein